MCNKNLNFIPFSTANAEIFNSLPGRRRKKDFFTFAQNN